MKISCAICDRTLAIAVLTVAGSPPKPTCRACGLSEQRSAQERGIQATVEEMGLEPMAAPPHWGTRP